MAPVPSTLGGRVLPPGTFYWPVTEDQSRRLSELLDVNFSELRVHGAYIGSPQLICSHCGKLSGLEDFIAEALKLGIHTPEFIIEDLKEGGRGEHKQILHCMDCGNAYLRSGTDEEVERATMVELQRRSGIVSSDVERDVVEREPEPGLTELGERVATTEPAIVVWHPNWLTVADSEPEERSATPDKREAVPAPAVWYDGWIGVEGPDLKARVPKPSEENMLAGREPHPAPAVWHAGWLEVEDPPVDDRSLEGLD